MKKKNKNSCIIVGEHKCKKIGSDLFYNLDTCLAIIIRDMLYEFAETEALANCPTYYTLDEEGKEISMKKACKKWQKDIRDVAELFDRYIINGFRGGYDEILSRKMFKALSEIFPALWI